VHREAIPIESRIVCVCDAYNAMTTDRPYRGAKSQSEALEELRRCSGTQFDRGVVQAMERVMGDDHVSDGQPASEPVLTAGPVMT